MLSKDKKILVTGADGFIGSHLSESLVRSGYDVRAFVMYNSFNTWGWLDTLPKEIRNNMDIFCGDIRDPYGVKKALQSCDTVFHLAALIGIPYSYHSPHTYIDTNVKGTLNILQAAIELGIKRVIHTSTSEVYGTAKFVPITEEHPLQPQSPYSASKMSADHLALSFYHSFATPVVIVRPFNTYGPRQSLRAVIPTVITQIAKGHTDISLGALYPTRDFNYVNDIVNGFIAVAQAENVLGETINLGSSFEISILDTVNLIADIMQKQINIVSDENRFRPANSEVERLYADNSKALNLLDWSPKYGSKTGLKEGLIKTINWFTEPENIVKYKDGIYAI